MGWRKYKADAPIRLKAGQLRLSENDMRLRRFSVDDLGGGVCEILKEVHFRAGDEFEFKGELPKKYAVTRIDDYEPVNIAHSGGVEDEADEIAAEIEAETESDTLELIVEAIAELGEDDYTTTGLPEVKSIERVLGVDITAAQRGQAWKLYQERNQ